MNPETTGSLFKLATPLFLRVKAAPFGLSGSSAITTWNYGPATGFLMSKVYADGKGPSYTYTDAGRLLTRQWARTCAVGGGTALVTGSYGYNNAGEVETILYMLRLFL